MTKPRVFIGSSSEGLPVAEAIFDCLNRETEPTLWTHQIFTPGAYPLEALDEAIRRHSFAVLVASPDDEVMKRGAAGLAMRDNVLLEFGLFAGAFGRKRVFFVCPDRPKLDLPSDLFGVLTTTYQAERATASTSDCAAAVQTACKQIRDTVREQWLMIQKREVDRETRIRASEESQAIQRLHSVSTRLRDALMALQRDSFAAFSDRTAFEEAKKRTADEVSRISGAFAADARAISAHGELEQLRGATHEALLALPFPEELSAGPAAAQDKAIGVGLGALDTILRGGDPLRDVQRAAEDEAGGRLASLARRYSEWWDRYSQPLQQATARMQDALFSAMVRISSEHFTTDMNVREHE